MPPSPTMPKTVKANRIVPSSVATKSSTSHAQTTVTDDPIKVTLGVDSVTSAKSKRFHALPDGRGDGRATPSRPATNEMPSSAEGIQLTSLGVWLSQLRSSKTGHLHQWLQDPPAHNSESYAQHSQKHWVRLDGRDAQRWHYLHHR